jgi:hypothetical protein
MAKRKQKIAISPMRPDIKARFEKLIRTKHKDHLDEKYKKIAAKTVFNNDDDLKL